MISSINSFISFGIAPAGFFNLMTFARRDRGVDASDFTCSSKEKGTVRLSVCERFSFRGFQYRLVRALRRDAADTKG